MAPADSARQTPVGRWPADQRISRAVLTFLGDEERVIVFLPNAKSSAFKRAHKGSVGMFGTLRIAITNERILFFQVQRDQLVLIYEQPRKNVQVVGHERGQGNYEWEDSVELRIGDQTMTFSFWRMDTVKVRTAVGVLGGSHFV